MVPETPRSVPQKVLSYVAPSIIEYVHQLSKYRYIGA
eukprot:COSAG02_NODE_25000_length_671_cov_1.129371_2_plen_36_part_01